VQSNNSAAQKAIHRGAYTRDRCEQTTQIVRTCVGAWTPSGDGRTSERDTVPSQLTPRARSFHSMLFVWQILRLSRRALLADTTLPSSHRVASLRSRHASIVASLSQRVGPRRLPLTIERAVAELEADRTGDTHRCTGDTSRSTAEDNSEQRE
jgi:hypothetical protein